VITKGRSPDLLIENNVLTGKAEGRSPETYQPKGQAGMINL